MAILECKDLTKYYDRTLGLDHLSLQLEPGRIVGLLGPNGSGKTTLLKIANGLLTPSSGQLLIDGKAPGPDTRRLVSYLPERTYLSDWMTVVQLLDFFCDFYPDFDREAAEHMLTALEISPTQRIKQMSKGTREKVQLILVMSRRTRLYLLDGTAAAWIPPPETTSSTPSSPTSTRTPLCSSPPTSSPTWSGFWTTWCSSAGVNWCCTSPWTRSGRSVAAA